jgi:hypothetical protein
MKVVVWNMNHRVKSWEGLARLDGDVALLSEARVPKTLGMSAQGGERRTARRVGRSLVLVVGLPLLTLGLTVGKAAASGAGRVTIYPGIDVPYEIAAGPDGALWFTNSGNASIGRITTTGTVTNYTGTGISAPSGITAGPDGALWFTNYLNNSIGRITTAGAVTNYTGTGINGPSGIVAGPDGALWFTNHLNGLVAQARRGSPPAPHISPGRSGEGRPEGFTGACPREESNLRHTV